MPNEDGHAGADYFSSVFPSFFKVMEGHLKGNS